MTGKSRAIVLAAIIVVGGLAYFWLGRTGEPVAENSNEGAPIVAVVVPELTENATIGKRAFAAKCSACHGENAGGRDGLGPPLVHKIYEPSHHGDAAFLLAAQRGVRSHHWPFGNMPPVPGITPAEVQLIIEYVRELQLANGIG